MLLFDFVSVWKSKDGIICVEVFFKGDFNDNEMLCKFVVVVFVVELIVIGGLVLIFKFGDIVVKVFIYAGVYVLLVIGLLLWVMLCCFVDVLMMLVLLLVVGVVMFEICVLIGLLFNFVNIVVFLLLLGVGVVFKIYYVVVWCLGRMNFF